MKTAAKFLLFLLLLVTGFVFGNQIQNNGRLRIKVEGIRNNNGLIGISIYNSSSGFPNDQSKSLKTEFVTIKNNTVEITVDSLTQGYYAISAFHDENSNRKMETNWIGIPKEGVGVSNNAKGSFGPPKFNDAKFYFNKQEQTIILTLTYL